MCANVVRKAPQKSYTTLSKETNPGERGLPPQLPRPFPIVKKKTFYFTFFMEWVPSSGPWGRGAAVSWPAAGQGRGGKGGGTHPPPPPPPPSWANLVYKFGDFQAKCLSFF